ncbi:hypothetical protein C6P45_004552 [Maudiozyma exigua]|uniref:Altered inheritance of mitochondria protein 3 n=1 Tax=Maudiozyma exigua TaxID=34358 RepID=A0A9P7BB29_MAUEX|nr:hypothetical protein C6P45_004552 [Kazachstania exigua]
MGFNTDSLKKGVVSVGKISYNGTKKVAKAGYSAGKGQYDKHKDHKGDKDHKGKRGKEDDTDYDEDREHDYDSRRTSSSYPSAPGGYSSASVKSQTQYPPTSPAASGYQPGVTPQSATPYQPGVTPAATPYKPGVTPSVPYQPGVTPKPATPYQPGVIPAATPYQPGVTPQHATPYQPGVTPAAAPYKPGVSPYQQAVNPTAAPAVTPYQPGVSPYQAGTAAPGTPAATPYQPGVSPYQQSNAAPAAQTAQIPLSISGAPGTPGTPGAAVMSAVQTPVQPLNITPVDITSLPPPPVHHGRNAMIEVPPVEEAIPEEPEEIDEKRVTELQEQNMETKTVSDSSSRTARDPLQKSMDNSQETMSKKLNSDLTESLNKKEGTPDDSSQRPDLHYDTVASESARHSRDSEHGHDIYDETPKSRRRNGDGSRSRNRDDYDDVPRSRRRDDYGGYDDIPRSRRRGDGNAPRFRRRDDDYDDGHMPDRDDEFDDNYDDRTYRRRNSRSSRMRSPARFHDRRDFEDSGVRSPPRRSSHEPIEFPRDTPNGRSQSRRFNDEDEEDAPPLPSRDRARSEAIKIPPAVIRSRANSEIPKPIPSPRKIQSGTSIDESENGSIRSRSTSITKKRGPPPVAPRSRRNTVRSDDNSGSNTTIKSPAVLTPAVSPNINDNEVSTSRIVKELANVHIRSASNSEESEIKQPVKKSGPPQVPKKKDALKGKPPIVPKKKIGLGLKLNDGKFGTLPLKETTAPVFSELKKVNDVDDNDEGNDNLSPLERYKRNLAKNSA